MKGLNNLIRLHKRRLEDKRQRLAQLRAVADGFSCQIAALDAEARIEAENAGDSPDAAHAIGAFVQATLARRDALKSSLADVQGEIDALQQDISEAFREVKRYEVVEERRESRAKRSVLRRERKVQDEIGIGIYQRRRTIAGA